MSHWRDLRITALTISVAEKVAKKVQKIENIRRFKKQQSL